MKLLSTATTTPALIINGRVEQWHVTPPRKLRRIGIVQLIGDDEFVPFFGFGKDRRQLASQPSLEKAVNALVGGPH